MRGGMWEWTVLGLEWNVALETGRFLVGEELKIEIDLQFVRLPDVARGLRRHRAPGLANRQTRGLFQGLKFM